MSVERPQGEGKKNNQEGHVVEVLGLQMPAEEYSRIKDLFRGPVFDHGLLKLDELPDDEAKERAAQVALQLSHHLLHLSEIIEQSKSNKTR